MKGYFRKRNDKWSYTVDIGRDPLTGKRKQKTQSGFKTKKEAQLACAEYITKIEKEGFVDTKKITLSQFMREYIDNEIIPNFRPSTINNYNKSLDHVNNSIGNIELSKLNAMHMQQFSKYLRNKDYKNGTINLYITCLKKVLHTAHEWRMLTFNIATSLKRAKSERKIDKFWTYDECMNFLTTVKEDKHYLIYLLTVFTGMRRGEVLGLSETNCNFVTNTITITQQVATEEGQPYLTTKLKSNSSYRTIEVPGEVMQTLKRYNMERKKLFLKLGFQKEQDLIFVTQEGKMITPNYLSRCFKELCTKHNFKNISFHGLRHSHATLLAESKEHVQAIADRLGHSSPSITNEMYIHLTDKMKNSLIDKLETLYQQGKEA